MATLIRLFGDIDLAQDAVQDAFAAALATWPHDGVPPNPGGWVTTTARNRAIDRLRRDGACLGFGCLAAVGASIRFRGLRL